EETKQVFSPRSRFIFSSPTTAPQDARLATSSSSPPPLAALVEVWASSPRGGDQEVAAVAGAGAHAAFGDLVALSLR
ncbi:hypothetical protein B296_00028345, partial [Ensete ventricosum]